MLKLGQRQDVNVRHLMVDTETLGKVAGYIVLSIGATVFDPYSGALGDTFYTNIDRNNSKEWGLKSDPGTEQWWKDQSEEANACLLTDPQPLLTSLLAFSDFYNQHAITHIWAHGTVFDIPILAGAYKAVEITEPWHFRAPKDTRTLFDLVGIDDLTPFRVGTHHDALGDALTQAHAVINAYERLRNAACACD